jgi:hypothetical protein
MEGNILILNGSSAKIFNLKSNIETKFCGKYESSNIQIKNAKCKCGREKWYHPSK